MSLLDRHIAFLIIALGHIDNQMARFQKQGLSIGMRGKHGAIAWQGKAERFGQTIHRVCSKHP